MWCSETMAWTDTQLRRFDDIQVGMTAIMLNLKRRWQDGETWIQWMMRRVRTARYFIEFWTPGFVSTCWLRDYYRWAGQRSQMEKPNWEWVW